MAFRRRIQVLNVNVADGFTSPEASSVAYLQSKRSEATNFSKLVWFVRYRQISQYSLFLLNASIFLRDRTSAESKVLFLEPIVISVLAYLSCRRHGEAEHNTASEWTLRDPSLTMHGRRQARAARAALVAQGVLGAQLFGDAAEGPGGAVDAQLVVASPLRRTLQTAEILCAGTLLPLVAHPGLQETSQAFPVPVVLTTKFIPLFVAPASLSRSIF